MCAAALLAMAKWEQPKGVHQWVIKEYAGGVCVCVCVCVRVCVLFSHEKEERLPFVTA